MAGPFKKVEDESFWRRIAIATWRHPRNPQIYAALEIDATAVETVLEEAMGSEGPKITPTALVGKGIGEAISAYPEINGIIVRGRVQQRETVDVWFNVAFDEGDLFGAKVEDVEAKSAGDIAQELTDTAEKIRTKRSERMDDYKRITHTAPSWLLRPVLWLVDVLNFRLKIPLTWFGVERDPFGTVMVTNVATFDVDQTVFAPIPPLMRMPAVIVLGKIHQKPVVEDGEIVAKPILPLYVTVDHRYLDGFHAVKMLRTFEDFLTDEEALRAALARREPT